MRHAPNLIASVLRTGTSGKVSLFDPQILSISSVSTNMRYTVISAYATCKHLLNCVCKTQFISRKSLATLQYPLLSSSCTGAYSSKPLWSMNILSPLLTRIICIGGCSKELGVTGESALQRVMPFEPKVCLLTEGWNIFLSPLPLLPFF